MKASRKDLTAAIMAIIDQAPDQRAVAEEIAAYLVSERQTKELDAIMRELEQRRFDRYGVLEVSAISARPLSDGNRDAIRALFDAKEIIINEEQDNKILGGVKVRALQKSADFSVQARLRQLRFGV